MVDEPRQVQAPSATGWLLDLSPARGPLFAVVAEDHVAALEKLTLHLVAAGVVGDGAGAAELLADAQPESLEVVW